MFLKHSDEKITANLLPSLLSASDDDQRERDKRIMWHMNCEMETLSAIFSVQWDKSLNKMTHASGSVLINEILCVGFL